MLKRYAKVFSFAKEYTLSQLNNVNMIPLENPYPIGSILYFAVDDGKRAALREFKKQLIVN